MSGDKESITCARLFLRPSHTQILIYCCASAALTNFQYYKPAAVKT